MEMIRTFFFILYISIQNIFTPYKIEHENINRESPEIIESFRKKDGFKKMVNTRLLSVSNFESNFDYLIDTIDTKYYKQILELDFISCWNAEIQEYIPDFTRLKHISEILDTTNRFIQFVVAPYYVSKSYDSYLVLKSDSTKVKDINFSKTKTLYLLNVKGNRIISIADVASIGFSSGNGGQCYTLRNRKRKFKLYHESFYSDVIILDNQRDYYRSVTRHSYKVRLRRKSGKFKGFFLFHS